LDELNFWVEPDGVYEAFQLIRQDGVLQNYEADICTKQGEIRTLIYNAVLLDIPGKNVVAFSAEDVTEQKEAERRIKEYQAQLKSLASELSLAEERERRRIAAGIHDDIAQKLAMAKFELQSLQASVTGTDVLGSLERQCQLMDQVVADARSLTFELSNPVLYQVGLEAAVESYLTERIEGQFGLKCKFKSEGPRSSLAEDIRVVLFQAVRGLLTNIMKHARASTVEVYVSSAEDRLRIVVQDDGVGFDPAKIGPHLVGSGGFGLFNIKERLEYLGGNVKIESARKKGARVTMTVPSKQMRQSGRRRGCHENSHCG
jgi:signal transduction histidine kinase